MGTFHWVEQHSGGTGCQSQSWKVPGPNPTDSLSWALRPTHYEASGDLCLKSDMHSGYHINDTPSSSVT